MSESNQLLKTVQNEIQHQLREHFFVEAIQLTNDDIKELEKMALDELPSYIQTGIHEAIHVFMDAKQHIQK